MTYIETDTKGIPNLINNLKVPFLDKLGMKKIRINQYRLLKSEL
jgi:hypothetical protein